MKRNILPIIVILVLVASFFLLNINNEPNQTIEKKPNLYTNERYGFQFRYSDNQQIYKEDYNPNPNRTSVHYLPKGAILSVDISGLPTVDKDFGPGGKGVVFVFEDAINIEKTFIDNVESQNDTDADDSLYVIIEKGKKIKINDITFNKYVYDFKNPSPYAGSNKEQVLFTKRNDNTYVLITYRIENDLDLFNDFKFINLS